MLVFVLLKAFVLEDCHVNAMSEEVLYIEEVFLLYSRACTLEVALWKTNMEPEKSPFQQDRSLERERPIFRFHGRTGQVRAE